MVNPPLASTAIGVVPPEKAGMAAGISATFRQIGIATGIAALGSIFTSAMEHNLTYASPLLVTGILALVGSLSALLLIRSKARRSQQSVRRTGPQAPTPGSEQVSRDGTSPARSA